MADLDALTLKCLNWVNVRREFLDRPPLADLEPADSADPICESLGATWVMGCMQVEYGTGIGQYDVPDFIRRWLAEWRAGDHPSYQRNISQGAA